jgi:hypothetical protein
MKITKISAIGTRGRAAGLEFVAKQDRNGKYVLSRKAPSTSATMTNYSVNKVYVDTLDQAWNLLQKDGHLINLIGPTGRALRNVRSVKTEHI